jgi:Domain of unknown function (DUF4390)
MHCSRGIEIRGRFRVWRPFRLVVLACVLCLCPSVQGAEIAIRHASTKQLDDGYALDARIEFSFDDDIRNALDHGVELNIDVFIEIRRERKWLWDPTIKKVRRSFALQNHPLSNNYIVRDVDSGDRHQFASLPDALRYIGTIGNLHVLNPDEIESDEKYEGFIKAELNVETLPAPLQPIAYVSGYWRTESSWYEWVVR